MEREKEKERDRDKERQRERDKERETKRDDGLECQSSSQYEVLLDAAMDDLEKGVVGTSNPSNLNLSELCRWSWVVAEKFCFFTSSVHGLLVSS